MVVKLRRRNKRRIGRVVGKARASVKRVRITRARPKIGRSLNGNMAGFPRKIKVKHRYFEAAQQLNCTTGAPATYVWSCNGMYDPDITGTGHQPLYFDQMSLIYDHYHVIASKITLILQTSEDPIGPCVGALWVDDDSSTTASGAAAVGMIGEQGNKVVNFGGTNQKPNMYLSRTWAAKKFFPGSVLGNDSLKGTPSANPTEQSYFKFTYNTLDATSATIYLTVKIEYIAIWNEKKEVAQS